MNRSILLLLSNESDREILEEWIDEATEYTLSSQPYAQDTVFDLCILDKESFEENKSWLIERKEESRPLLLPYLIVVPEQQQKLLDRIFSENSENLLRENIDEVITTPLRKQKLKIRIDSLLKMREQSREVEDKESYKEITRRLREREETLEVIRSVNRTLIEQKETQDLIDSVAQQISESEGFGCTFIALTQGKQISYICEAQGSLTLEQVSSFHSEEYIEEVFEESPLVIEDVTQPPYRQHFVPKEKHGAVAFSIKYNSHRFGTLTVHFPPKSPPTERDIGLLDELSNDLASTLDRIRQANLRQESERQLQVLDRVLRHNMHNKMNVILGYSEVLETQLSGESREESREAINKIRQTGKQLVQTTDKERQIVEIISEKPEPEKLTIDEAVKDIVTQLRQEYPEADIDCDFEEDIEVLALPQIREAVHELLLNAVVHSDGEPEVEAEIKSNRLVDICVTDNNPRIPEEEAKVLTDGRQIDPLYHGSGMGLWLVNWVVKKSNGELEFEASRTRGNLVRIRLPKAGRLRF